MRFIDYLAIAFRNIRRQKLRSVLTIFAVVIGATSITIMLAAVFSLKGFITKQFEANGTFQQVAVSPQTDLTWNDHSGSGQNCPECVKLTNDLVAKIGAVQHVVGVARQTQVGQFQALSYGSQKLRVNQLVAYDANGIIANNVLAGRDLSSNDKAGVLTLTADYADKLGFKNNYRSLVGKQVSLISQGFYSGVGSDPLKAYHDQQAWFMAHPDANGQDYQQPLTTLTATVVGIMDTSNNNLVVRVPLEWAHGMQDNQMYQVTRADRALPSKPRQRSPLPTCWTKTATPR